MSNALNEYLELQARIHGESDIKAYMQRHGLEIPIAFGEKDRLDHTRARMAIAEYLQRQQAHVHYAELYYNDYENAFLGVFSTLELAQAACAEHAKETTGETLEWTPRGDACRATGTYDYIVTCILVDDGVLW